MRRANIPLFGVIFTLSLMLSNFSSAQGLGVKAGLNMAQFSGKDLGNVDFIWGFAFGGFVFWDIGEHFRIQPELLFNIKGSQKEDPIIEKMDKMSTKLTYLDVPVLIKYKIRTKGKLKLNIFFGPTLGWNIKANMMLESGGDISEEDIDNIKNIDFGLIVGFGSIFINKITVDLRYYQGLISINAADKTRNEKNRVLSLMLGYCL